MVADAPANILWATTPLPLKKPETNSMTRKSVPIVLCSGLFVLAGLCTPLHADSLNSISDKPLLLATVNSKDDGKDSNAKRTRAAKLAQKKSNGKILKVLRGTAGYTMKVLTPSGRVQEIWIAD